MMGDSSPIADNERKAGRRPWSVVCGLAIFVALILLLVGTAAGQSQPQPVDFGGGEFPLEPLDEIGDDERGAIQAMIAANTARLAAEGRLVAPLAAQRVSLGWPLRARDGLADPGYHGVTGFVDHATGYPNQLLDYSCGRRTYDSSSGYNHQGTDYFLWPFAWNKMAAGDVTVVAAADGVIVGRHEGYPDQSCGYTSSRWNAVYVRHADGSVAWYGHLKRGSVTAQGVGATVARGEYLGLVGSSGNSSAPHLHFELYSGGVLADPYAGSCNALDGGTWWATQRAYYDSAINKLTTGPAPVEWRDCPGLADPHEATQFQPRDRIYFTAYYRDQVDSLPSLYRILDPQGNVYAQWSHTSNKPHYAVSYWYWAYTFPASVPPGTWQFEAQFNGQTTRHPFAIGPASTPAPTATATATPTATPMPSPTPRFDPSRFIFVPSVAK